MFVEIISRHQETHDKNTNICILVRDGSLAPLGQPLALLLAPYKKIYIYKINRGGYSVVEVSLV